MDSSDVNRSIAYVIDFIVISVISIISGIIFSFLIILGPFGVLFILLINIFNMFILPVLYFYLLDPTGTLGHRVMKLKPNLNNASTDKRLIRVLLKHPIPALFVFIFKLITGNWIHDQATGITVQKA